MRRALVVGRLVFWAVIVWISSLVILAAARYFSFDGGFPFLVEKGAIAERTVWRAAFYLHIAGSLVCLVTGPLLFSRLALVRWTALHRWLGRAYVWALLAWAVPGGIVLAVDAKGGAPSAIGFLILGVLWFATTAKGLVEIKRRRIDVHVQWMARSYALALSALSFRLIQAGLFWAGLDDSTNYVVSLWLSLLLSVAHGECWAWISRRHGIYGRRGRERDHARDLPGCPPEHRPLRRNLRSDRMAEEPARV